MRFLATYSTALKVLFTITTLLHMPFISINTLSTLFTRHFPHKTEYILCLEEGLQQVLQ
jgi:hypothetical protein